MSKTIRKPFIGKYSETGRDGREVVRYATKGRYTKEEQAAMRDDFVKEAKAGRQICLSDLMINHGM